MTYKPIKVNRRTYRNLMRDAPGWVFFRIDESGQRWVKAAFKMGRIAIEQYQL